MPMIAIGSLLLAAAVGGSLAIAAGTHFAPEEIRQRIDHGIVIDERRRELSAESHSSSSAASRTAWSEPMPNPASCLRVSTWSGRIPSEPPTFAAIHVAIASRFEA